LSGIGGVKYEKNLNYEKLQHFPWPLDVDTGRKACITWTNLGLPENGRGNPELK